jgi:hypothetical protein
VGDPLSRPFARVPVVSISTPGDGDLVSGTVSITATASVNGSNGMGEDDFTLDMYGWRKFGDEFRLWKEQQADSIPDNIRIVSHKWFPAAHLDYYVAQPLHIDLIGIGELTDLHTYYWLNRTRRDLLPGDDALIIIPSNYPVNFTEAYKPYFRSLTLLHTFPVNRGGQVSRYFRVYKAENYFMNDQVHNGR